MTFDIFDLKRKEYGGFNHWIAKLFKYKYDYLFITFTSKWKRYEISHEIVYYDGYHNYIHIGFIIISYGT